MRIIQMAKIMLACFTGASLAAACGGSDGGDVSTGLEPTKLLSDVTPDEAEQACERLEAGMRQQLNRDKLINAVCTLFATAQASTPSSCNSMRDACIEEANQPGSDTSLGFDFEEIDFQCGSEESLANLEGCGDTTVSELETCFNDSLDQMNAMLNQYTCADAGTIDSNDLEGFGTATFEPAQSCEVIECGAGSPFG